MAMMMCRPGDSRASGIQANITYYIYWIVVSLLFNTSFP